MKKSLIIVVIVGLLAMLMLGCTPEAGQSPDQPAQEQETASLVNEPTTTPTPGSTTSSSEGGNFRLLISDEKNDIGDFDTLWVTISRIGVHQGGGSGNWTEWDVGEEGTVNLSALQGTNATTIWSGELVDGTYNKVFIYVSNVTGILDPDIEGDDPIVKLPGGKLQISKQFEVASGNVTNFVYDITVIKAGNSGKYILKPQIKESGPDQKFNDVGLKGKSESKGKPEDKGKPEGKGKPKDQESSANVEEVEDTTAPVITIDGVSQGENYTGNVAFTINVTDDTDPTPAVNATLTVNSTMNTIPSDSIITVSEIGEYELVVTAEDASGNEAESLVEFKIIALADTIAPVISVDGVIHGANYTGNVTFTISVTDDTDLTPAVNATLTVNSTTNNVPANLAIEVSDIGEYKLEVKAEDASGNEAEVTIEFEIKQP